jgi:hypothetical protein
MKEGTMLQKIHGARYWLAWSLCLVTFCVIWSEPVHVWRQSSALIEAERMQLFPTMSRTELIEESGAVHHLIYKPAYEDPVEYWQALMRQRDVESSYNRYVYENGDDFELRQHMASVINGTPMIALQQAYTDKFGRDAVIAARPDLESTGYFNRYAVKGDWQPFLQASLVAYGYSALLAMLFFATLALYSEVNLLPEFARLPTMAVIWPYAMLFAGYPFRVDPKKQMQQARQVIVYAFSLLLSLAGFGAASARAQSGSQGRKAEVVEIDKSGWPKLPYAGVELFPWASTGSGNTQLSPEYLATANLPGIKASMFGLLEVRPRENGWFTNHALTLTPDSDNLGFLSYQQEQGASAGGGSFVRGGPFLSVNGVPYFGPLFQQAFNLLGVAHLRQMHGDIPHYENKVVWASRWLNLFGDLQTSTTGFYRFRSERAKDFGQPQLWLRLKSLPKLWFGTEIELSGGEPTYLVGAKVTL